MMSDITRIDIRFPSRRTVLSCCKPEGALISILVPSAENVTVGERVHLRVTVDKSPQVFDLVGNVIWRRDSSWGPGKEPGFGLRISAEDKEPAVRLLAFCANRPPEQGTAQEKRIIAAFRCSIIHGATKIRAHVHDISASGAFVILSTLGSIRVGTEIMLRFTTGFLGLGGPLLKARVIWRGMKGELPGFGARFIGNPAEIRHTLRKQLGPYGR